MSDVGLSASLEVNADGVQTGTTKAITSLEALQNEIIKTQEQLKSAADDQSFNTLATKYNSLAKNIDLLSKGNIKIAPVDLKPLTDAGTEVAQLSDHISGLGNTVNRTMHGVADLFIAPGRAALIFANDIPLLVSKLQTLKAEQDAIAAAGGEAKTTTQLLTEAFNPLGLVIGLTSIAMIELLPKFISYIEESNKVITANETMSEALGNDKGYADAIANVNKLSEDIELAKDGFLSKTAVVKEYNDTIGKTTGQVSTLDQAEQALEKNKDAYLQMMAQKAVAAYAYQKSAEESVKAQQDLLNFGNKPGIGEFAKGALQTAFTGTFDPFNSVLSDRAKDIKTANDQADQLKTIAEDAEAQAAEIAKSFNFNLFGTNGDKTAKTQAQKIADAVAQVQRAQESLNDEFAHGDINNVQYYQKSIDLLTSSIAKLHDQYNLPFDGKILSGLQQQLDQLKLSAPINLTAIRGGQDNVTAIADQIAKTVSDATKLASQQIKESKNYALPNPFAESFGNIEDINKNLSAQKQTINLKASILPQFDLKEASNKLSDDTSAIDKLIQEHLKGEVSDKDFNIELSKLKIAFNKDEIDAQGEEVAEAYNKAIESSISGISEAIGTAIGSGNLSGLFDGVLSAFGGAVEQFGEEMLGFAIEANILFDSLSSLFFTPAGIAAAAGIIAIGAAIKSAASKGAKSGSGASLSSSPSYYGGQYSASAYAPTYSAPSSASATANIAATQNSPMTATVAHPIPIALDLNISGESTIENDKIKIAYDRATKMTKR